MACSPLPFPQKTIKKSLSCHGRGLHTGKEISLTLHPAPANMGIIFSRTDIAKEKTFPLKAHHVSQTTFNTKIAHPNNQQLSISTIEHLLSALHAASIDNLFIEVNGPELPALDGSAKEFLMLLYKAGIQNLNIKRQFIKILRPLTITDSHGAWVRLTPTEKNIFKLHVTIDFPAPIIGKQAHHYELSYENEANWQASLEDYKTSIAPARTFIDYDSIQKLQSQGLALGGTLSNALVVKKDHVLNPEGLSFANEFARHKLLDALGDLYCNAHNLIGNFEGFKSGHSLNNQLLQTFLTTKENWCFI